MKTLKIVARAFIFFIFVGFIFFGWGIYTLVKPSVIEKKEYVIHIPEHATHTDVTNTVYGMGLIRSSFFFDLYIQSMYGSKTPQSGEFRIHTPVSGVYLGRLIFSGLHKNEKNIVFIEGWTRKDIGAYLEKQGFGTQQDFLEVTQTSSILSKYPKFTQEQIPKNLEGYLFPDTYRVYETTSLKEIVTKMLDTLDAKITPDIQDAIRSHGLSLHQALTLASILEREVQSDSDKSKVADILYRRLEKGMPLQVDSTLNFITEKGSVRASLEDTKIDSLYNTYQVKGLPPGPIANPGISSIRAIAYPTPNDFLFFLTTPQGEVKYAKTFEEHVENKRKYLK